MVKKVPDTQMILDHFGTPLGVGPYANKREEIFEQWKKDIKEISKLCQEIFNINSIPCYSRQKKDFLKTVEDNNKLIYSYLDNDYKYLFNTNRFYQKSCFCVIC